MTVRTCLAIVLAAGEGTRMRSARPKVLHPLTGRSLLAHVVGAIGQAGVTATAVVKRVCPAAECFVQRERRGTAHAALAARAAIERRGDDVLIVYGDTPLV